MQSDLRNALNKLRWDSGSGRKGYIEFVDRSAHQVSLARCEARDLLEVAKDYFSVCSGSEVKYIPMHRVVSVKSESGVLWRSKRWSKIFGEDNKPV